VKKNANCSAHNNTKAAEHDCNTLNKSETVAHRKPGPKTGWEAPQPCRLQALPGPARGLFSHSLLFLFSLTHTLSHSLSKSAHNDNMNQDAPQGGYTLRSVHSSTMSHGTKNNITCVASDTRCDEDRPPHRPAQGTAPHSHQLTPTKHNQTLSSEMEAPGGTGLEFITRCCVSCHNCAWQMPSINQTGANL
jgi:hypothetical protein